jgi:23S rRNA pseudouridine2605 synthase
MSRISRINRYLAAAGLGSRRACEDLIRRGLVEVNGKKVDKLSMTIDTDTDRVTVEGREVKPLPTSRLLVLNKPTGVISTASDTHGRKTVIDIAREQGYAERLFPVGRLDRDTSGMLLITNDGDLAYRLTHPKYKVEKVYDVTVAGRVSDGTAKKISRGMQEGDFVTKPCSVTILERDRDSTRLEIRLREGRKRQIRRMLAICGHRVERLHRTALGDLEFPDLAIGDMRPLSEDEERRLRELSGLD